VLHAGACCKAAPTLVRSSGQAPSRPLVPGATPWRAPAPPRASPTTSASGSTWHPCLREPLPRTPALGGAIGPCPPPRSSAGEPCAPMTAAERCGVPLVCRTHCPPSLLRVLLVFSTMAEAGRGRCCLVAESSSSSLDVLSHVPAGGCWDGACLCRPGYAGNDCGQVS